MCNNSRPVYFGFEKTVDCPEHGPMKRVKPRFVTFDEKVFVLREEANISICEECSREKIKEETSIDVPKEIAGQVLWQDTAHREWNEHIERLFLYIGEGRVDDDGDAIIHSLSEDIPEKVMERYPIYTPSESTINELNEI